MIKSVKASVVNKWRYRDIDRDYSDVIQAIEECRDSDIIVFPESCLVNFHGHDDFDKKINGLNELSMKHEIIICIGLDETIHDDKGARLYNSAFLIDGDKVNIYRKTHLVWDEPDTTCFGDIEFPVFDTKIGRIGVLICYDNMMPESMRCLKLNGAEIVCKLSAWPDTIEDDWDFFTRARARENLVFLIASNDCSLQKYDDEGKGSINIKYCGNSRIVDPYGKVLVNLNSDNQPYSIATVKLDPEKLESVKAYLGPNTDPVKSRRPEFYSLISKIA